MRKKIGLNLKKSVRFWDLKTLWIWDFATTKYKSDSESKGSQKIIWTQKWSEGDPKIKDNFKGEDDSKSEFIESVTLKNEPKTSLLCKCKLETCLYWTKTCPHWTCFGTSYPKNGVGLALTLDKNFKFSKGLFSPKFKHNSLSMAVKKKKFYYIFILTFDRVNIPLQSMVNDVVENFFLHCHTHWIVLVFWG